MAGRRPVNYQTGHAPVRSSTIWHRDHDPRAVGRDKVGSRDTGVPGPISLAPLLSLDDNFGLDV
jgi:hypothetical protein